MAKLTIFGTPLGHPPTSQPLTILSSNPRERTGLAPYQRTAIRLLAEHDFDLPDWDSLTLIVESALASRDLYFAASMTRPTHKQLDEHFAAFVLSCAEPPTKSGAA
jgi:hypothetical protein